MNRRGKIALEWCEKLRLPKELIRVHHIEEKEQNKKDVNAEIGYVPDLKKWVMQLYASEFDEQFVIPHELGHMHVKQKMNVDLARYRDEPNHEICTLIGRVEDLFNDYTLVKEYPELYDGWLKGNTERLKGYPVKEFTSHYFITFFFTFPFEFQFIRNQFDYEKDAKVFDSFMYNIVKDNEGNFPVDVKDFYSNYTTWYHWFDRIKDLNDLDEYCKFAYDVVNSMCLHEPKDIKNSILNTYGHEI